MCQSRLPSELVEEIIDLQCDDLPTLKTGCLVNSQWLTRCRHHLFYSLSLSVKETFDFLKLLEGNISIGLNVQELLVHAVAARFQLNYTPANQTELLFEVLDRLPNLRTLRLHQVVYCCPSDLSYCKPWQPRQKTVIRYLELRGLCGVAERIAYTLSLFAKVPVNELHLDAVTVLEPSFNADHESPRRLEFLKSVMSGWQVTSLRIDLYNPPFWLINLFRAILSVDSLRSLEVGETALAGSYAILFEQFGPSLDSLRLNMWDLKDDAIKETFRQYLLECPLLESLQLCCRNLAANNSQVASLLQLVCQTTKQITFCIGVDVEAAFGNPLLRSSWTPLEQVLLNIRELEHVRFVAENLTNKKRGFGLRNQVILDDVQQQLVKDCLPKLETAGLLSFE